jgi:hypothetical protein
MQEVVRVLELNAIAVSEGADAIRLRIEVLRDLSGHDCYRARLLRWDTYSIAPSFGNPTGERNADEEILVVDPLWDWMGSAARTPREALELVLSRLREQLPSAGIPEASVVDW